MPKYNRLQTDFNRAITASRIYRRELLDKVLRLIEEDESRHKRVPTVDWSVTGDIERQCEYLKQVLQILENERNI